MPHNSRPDLYKQKTHFDGNISELLLKESNRQCEDFPSPSPLFLYQDTSENNGITLQLVMFKICYVQS